MKLIKIINSYGFSNKHSEIHLSGTNRFIVFNIVSNRISRRFPNKVYYAKAVAEKYANKFLSFKE